MRLLTLLLLVWWGVLRRTQADNFAAVSGTGWTDITQLQSTCSTPGYYTNPSDCSRFYVCVDHSTPEHRLLLRYDFDCPAGTAFDESTKNCNYPGPSGCVTSGSGWGWSNQRESGLWQSTATVSRAPNSWGTPTSNPVSTTVIQSHGSSGRTILRGPSTPAPPLPSNPRVNIPSTVHIVQIPIGTWESFRLRPSNRVFQGTKVSTISSTESGGWAPNKISNSGVFESAKVTQQQGQNPSVAWGTSKIYPVDSTVFQSHTSRVTPVPPTEWETPQPFPQVVQTNRVIEETGNGWSSQVRVTPTPLPPPVNPSVTPSTVWQSARISPVPNNAVSYQRITTQVQQQQPASVGWYTQHAANPSLNLVQTNSPVPSNPALNVAQPNYYVPNNPSVNYAQSYPPTPNNPSLSFVQSTPSPVNNPPVTVIQGSNRVSPSYNVVQQTNVASNPTVSVPSGWENFRITQLPSGYTWQSSPNSNIESTQSQTFVSSTGGTPVPPQDSSSVDTSSLTAGNFGIVQQVINEDQGQGTVTGGKSHIQLVYESKEKQLAQQQSQSEAPAQNQAPQEISGNDPNNSLYEFITPPGSGFKGRIIVLYAPLSTKGGKREVPVIEVEVEDNDENSGNNAENE